MFFRGSAFSGAAAETRESAAAKARLALRCFMSNHSGGLSGATVTRSLASVFPETSVLSTLHVVFSAEIRFPVGGGRTTGVRSCKTGAILAVIRELPMVMKSVWKGLAHDNNSEMQRCHFGLAVCDVADPRGPLRDLDCAR